ncbi:winged helix-turn-helix domain-containing protein [Streptomyces prasinus]|uniref:PadR family transcriptional regulator n=1 Tax=Streptomyces prasinus TaxID=67345 RepID=UPI0033308FCD
MTVRIPRKTRRIIMALHNAQRPLTGGDLCRITCHWPGTVYPALEQLERAGWIEKRPTPKSIHGYQLTDRGRQHAGLPARGGGPLEKAGD